MTTYPYRIEILGKQDRTGFCSGSDELDQYFYKQVSQDVRRRVAGCNILIETATDMIAGFYTLSACHVYLSELPETFTKKLPRYPAVPSVLLGRLAIDQNFQGKKLGSVLLYDAVQRSIRSDVAAHMMLVDAKDDKAIAFYRHHGFVQDKDNPGRLFTSLDYLAKELGKR